MFFKVKFIHRLRYLILLIAFSLYGCGTIDEPKILTLGIVHYQPPGKSSIQLEDIAGELKKQYPNTQIRISSTTNYDKGIKIICNGEFNNSKWDVVFALSPVVSAKALECGYEPLYQAYGGGTYYSVLFVRKDSKIEDLEYNNLDKVSLALNQINSASGFYLPIYKLWNKTLNKILFVGDYDLIMDLVKKNPNVIGAIPSPIFASNSLYPVGTFKEIARSSEIPKGLVLINSKMKPEQKLKIKQSLDSISIEKIPKGSNNESIYNPKDITQSDYKELKEIIAKVESFKCYKNSPVKITKCN